MHQKIVVPLDGSEEAEKVLQIAQKMLAPGGDLVLLHILRPVIVSFGNVWEYLVFNDEIGDGERPKWISYLKDVCFRIGGAEARWRCDVAINWSVADGITNFATKEDADLIVMYTHDRRGLAKLIKGSIASDVQRRAPMKVRRVFDSLVLEEYTTAGNEAEEAEALNQLIPILKKVGLFIGLSEQQLVQVASLAQTVQMDAGDVLGEAGDLGENLFIVIRGEAELSFPSEVGKIAVRIAEPGDSFPVAALTGSGTLITSGQALTSMELLAIPVPQIEKLCFQNPDIGLRIYRNITDLFADRYKRTMEHLVLNAERKLKDEEFLAAV